MCSIKQFLRKMWPIQLAFLLFILCMIFLPSFTVCSISSFLTQSVQMIFPILLQHHISKFSRTVWSAVWSVIPETCICSDAKMTVSTLYYYYYSCCCCLRQWLCPLYHFVLQTLRHTIEATEAVAVLERSAVYGGCLPTFRRSLSVASSRKKESKKSTYIHTFIHGLSRNVGLKVRCWTSQKSDGLNSAAAEAPSLGSLAAVTVRCLNCVLNLYFCVSVVLLDTTQEATLEWTRYPYGPQANTPGVS
jgi:hypothetical protein